MKNKWIILFLFICSCAVLLSYLKLRKITVTDQTMVLNEDSSIVFGLASKSWIYKDNTIHIKRLPKNGYIKGNPAKLTYHSIKDFHGQDYLLYYASHGNQMSNIGKISIQVKPVNDRPVAKNQKYQLLEDHSVKIKLSASDIDNDNLHFNILQTPKKGQLLGIPPQLIYIPHKNIYGEDQFVYFTNDEKIDSSNATVFIKILPVNDPPVIKNSQKKTYKNSSLRIKIQSKDIEKDIVKYQIVRKPKHGRLKKDQMGYKYLPDKNFVGMDYFKYKAFDGVDFSSVATIDIKVKNFKKYKTLTKKLAQRIKYGGIAIGNHNNPDYVFHSEKYIPASILKIATASAALEILGENYRFKTNIYIDKERNLYIKGFGDPSLSTESWYEIAKILKTKGVFKKPINQLILDDSVFSGDIEFDGREKNIHYFNAPLGALATNLNTISVRIGKGHQINALKKETPITNIIIKKARRLPRGFQHFNIAKDSIESTIYTGEITRAIFEKYGAKFNLPNRIGKVPDKNKLLETHFSKQTLREIIRNLLRYSNNFVANQLLLVMALEKYGEGAEFKQGVNILDLYINQKIGIDKQNYSIVEGSGLSTKNRIDLLAMLKVVNNFKENIDLLPHLKKSKFRDLVRIGRNWNIYAKSGTLGNVSTLAGFFEDNQKQWIPFVIMLGKNKHSRSQVLEMIKQYYVGR